MPGALIVYDANGNTLSDAAGKQYTWDFENRLTQVVNPGVGTTAFRYDPFGRRIQKSGPLGTTNYLYDTTDIVEELDGAGGVLARYPDRGYIDEPLVELRSGTTGYYHADGLRETWRETWGRETWGQTGRFPFFQPSILPGDEGEVGLAGVRDRFPWAASAACGERVLDELLERRVAHSSPVLA